MDEVDVVNGVALSSRRERASRQPSRYPVRLVFTIHTHEY